MKLWAVPQIPGGTSLCFDNFGYDDSLTVTGGRVETVSETEKSNLTHQ